MLDVLAYILIIGTPLKPVLADPVTLTILIVGASIGGAAYQADKQRKAQHEAEDKVSKAQERQRQLLELQAGEYDAIEKSAMKIQALTSQTESLANVLTQQGAKQPTIFTLPGNESTAPIDRINRAIDDFIKGRN